jgi:hypothetical protein
MSVIGLHDNLSLEKLISEIPSSAGFITSKLRDLHM